MAFSNAGKNALLSGLASTATHVSIHSADPGTTGASESSSARQPIAWDAPSGGVMLLNGVEDIAMPVGSDAVYFGLWTALSAGSFLCGGLLAASEHFTAAGTYHLTEITLTG
jgi:hypothetical protein